MNFIDAHDFSVDLVLRVLDIAASTYYEWRRAREDPSRRARKDAELLRLIDEIRGEHEFAATYGSPRVWLKLRNRGVKVGRKRVARIMRANGRKGAYLRRGWKHGSTRHNPTTRRHRTCCTATSPPPPRTRSGSRTLRASSPARGCCGSPACEMRSPTRLSVGIPARA